MIGFNFFFMDEKMLYTGIDADLLRDSNRTKGTSFLACTTVHTYIIFVVFYYFCLVL